MALAERIELIPPQSIEAEQALLGAILRGGDSIVFAGIAETLASEREAFYDLSHQKLFNLCLEMMQENKPIDTVSVIERLDALGLIEEVGGHEYLLDLASSASVASNCPYYTKIIKDKCTLRKLIKAGRDIAETSYKSPDVEDALDFAQKKIFDIAQGRSTGAITHIADVSKSVWTAIEERSVNPGALLGISTGFYELDTLTSGLQKSDLIIVAARPSMGKTAFCLNLAEHAAIHEKSVVALFSLEMSKDQLVQRMICSNAGIDSQKVRTGRIAENEWVKISDAIDRLSSGKVFIDDSAALNVLEIRSKARKLKSEHSDLNLIIVDYLQLMQGTRQENRVQELSEISRGLKTLARELNIPIIALSQLSRAVEARQNKRPMLSDLRESGAIEQDADIVIFLYRQEYYEPEDIESRGICEVIIAKQRNGPVGTVNLQFHGATTRFRNLESLR